MPFYGVINHFPRRTSQICLSRASGDRQHRFVRSRNISGRAAEASIRHAQLFVYNLDGIKLRDVAPSILANYLDELGRCDNIVAWRFRQAVSAVEMLFEMLGLDSVLRAFNQSECREAA